MSLAYTLLVKQVIVAVKTDFPEQAFNQRKNEEIIKEVSTYIRKLATVAFAPISAWNSENMLKPSTNMLWPCMESHL